MPKVSVIIPTCNRPDLLPRAIKSVLAQTYSDFEIIIVDDGQEKSAEEVVRQFNDPRIRYIKHEKRKGGGAARNTGIKASQSEFIAFLDDDDEWLPEKLEIQMKEFENTPQDVGFCFTAVKNIYDDREEDSNVEEGVNDYHKISLTRFKGFLTSSLVVKKRVFEECEGFDESLPSHQEAELILRITKKYKGLGINQPLVKMMMITGHKHINSDLKNRIVGREMVLKKHFEEFRQYPEILAKHYFWLALWYRDDGQKGKAGEYFKKSWRIGFKARYFFHYLINLLG